MIDNKLQASEGQVQVKGLATEQYAWLGELPIEYKGKPLGNILKYLVEEIHKEKEKNEELAKELSSVKDELKELSERISLTERDIKNIKIYRLE